eukprot:RCo049534
MAAEEKAAPAQEAGETLFQILGVEESATEDDIKKSFRKLAIKYHPDKNPDGMEMFQKIQNAYDILADSDQRTQYLQLLEIQRNRSKMKDTSMAELRTKFRQFHDYRGNHRRKYERTCRDWARGCCTNDACPYWHYRVATAKKDKICQEYLNGTCKFGDECIFAHTNVIPTDDNDASYVKEWKCKTPTCGHLNELGKQMCSRCKMRRQMGTARFKNGTQVMLSHNKIVIIDEVIKRTLFLVEDGKTRPELTQIITAMKQMNLYGQVLGMITAFYPSSECYMLRLADGNSFICPETHCQSGVDRWTCERCKFSNLGENKACKLCYLPREGEDTERQRVTKEREDRERREREAKERERRRKRGGSPEIKKRSSKSRSPSRGRTGLSSPPRDRKRDRDKDKARAKSKDRDKSKENGKDKLALTVTSPKSAEEMEMERQWLEAKTKRAAERAMRMRERELQKELLGGDDDTTTNGLTDEPAPSEMSATSSSSSFLDGLPTVPPPGFVTPTTMPTHLFGSPTAPVPHNGFPTMGQPPSMMMPPLPSPPAPACPMSGMPPPQPWGHPPSGSPMSPGYPPAGPGSPQGPYYGGPPPMMPPSPQPVFVAPAPLYGPPAHSNPHPNQPGYPMGGYPPVPAPAQGYFGAPPPPPPAPGYGYQ